jgi:hypothetical protein
MMATRKTSVMIVISFFALLFNLNPPSIIDDNILGGLSNIKVAEQHPHVVRRVVAERMTGDNFRRRTLILFIVSAVLALILSFLAMSSSTSYISYDAGTLDLERDGVFEVFNHFHGPDSGIIDSLSIIISRQNCTCERLNYSVINLNTNETRNFILSENTTIVRLNTTYTILYFPYNSSRHCILGFTLRYTVRDYKYRYLSIPAFVFFAISIAAMYKYLTSYSVEKYYEKK